eukprot:1115594-Rhodomonas_salina.4
MAAREVAKAQCRKENQPLAPPMDASGRGEETRNIQSVLHSATAADIPTGDRAPIVISDDQPLVDALKFIADAWVRACPVRDTSTNTIIGTLDLRDIGQFMEWSIRAGEGDGQQSRYQLGSQCLNGIHSVQKRSAGTTCQEAAIHDCEADDYSLGIGGIPTHLLCDVRC